MVRKKDFKFVQTKCWEPGIASTNRALNNLKGHSTLEVKIISWFTYTFLLLLFITLKSFQFYDNPISY